MMRESRVMSRWSGSNSTRVQRSPTRSQTDRTRSGAGNLGSILAWTKVLLAPFGAGEGQLSCSLWKGGGMIGNRGSSDASTEGKAPKRRDGRGLGPLSSGHLTIIVVTLVVVVAFPFAAFAVTGNNVFVTDATSGTHAKVDSGGNVQTKVNGSSVELASGSGVNVAATGTRLAQLDVTRDERIRVTVANSCFSASAVRVTI